MRAGFYCLVLSVICIVWTVGAFCEQQMTEEDQAKYGLAQSLTNLKKYDEAVPLYEELLARYPENKDVLIGYVVMLEYNGRKEEAVILLDKLASDYEKTDTKNLAMKLRLAEIFALCRMYDRAIELCEDALEIEPGNKDAGLWLARFLSWSKRYKESLEAYSDLIKLYPEWALPRREKARVLGWMRKYKKSIEEYEKISREAGGDEASKREMQAKKNYFLRYYKNAIKSYKDWLAVEPDNLEALFDLGQSYSCVMQWDNARQTYEKTIKVLPSHFRAKQALKKVNIYSKMFALKGALEFYEAESAARDVDKKYYDLSADLKMPFHNDWYFSVRSDSYIYKFKEVSQLNSEKISAGFEYNQKPFWWAMGGYSRNFYSDGIKGTNNFIGELNVKPIDPATITFCFNRWDVIENFTTLNLGIRRDDYKIRGLAEINRRFIAGADYIYSDYSDDNQRDTYGIDLKSQLLYEPKSLTAFYRYESYGYDQKRSYYFSPASFHYNKIGLEWRHFLNKEELFWGTNDTYYTIRLSANLEVHDTQGYTIYFDLHRDWTDRLSSHLEASKMIYVPKSTYSEDKALFYMKYYF